MTRWTVLVAISLSICGRAWADAVTLGASLDNTIYSEDGGLSNGAGDYFFAGATKNADNRRGLVAFDVAGSIPAGSTIQSATLTLYMSRTRTQDQTVALHRVLAAWGEGTSHADNQEGAGAPATTDDATWTHRLYPGAMWASPGADFAAAPSATTLVGNATTDYSWSSPAMAVDVQAWLDDPNVNSGWILIGNEISIRVAKRFNSLQSLDPALRPRLDIGFTPPAPTGACCAGDGTCTIVLDPGGACGGTYLGGGSVCDPNPCPQPSGACCLPDAAATCVEDTAVGCGLLGGAFAGEFTACAATECPVVLDPYLDPLPLPAVAQPVTGTPGGEATYEIAMREVQQQLHQDLPPTTVWGYGDGASGATYPGPTIEATANQAVTVTWINDLRDTAFPGDPLRTQHYLPVDTCAHGADDASPRTVVHLHGGHVAAASDGYPEDTFLPSEQVTYLYPNGQLPATLWYHDHALGITRLNVMMGLAGFYLLRDVTEAALGLPSGEFEVPLVIQDRSFDPNGSFRYPASWQDHFFGDTVLVNGKVWPYLHVKQGKYRLRLLNGSNSRTYDLSLSPAGSFQQIGLEGGLLPAPVTISHVVLGPGERADVVVDFESYPAATEVYLTNSAPAPYPGDPGVGVIPDVLKFIVDGQPGHTAAVPPSLRSMEVLQEGDAIIERPFELQKGGDACSGTAWMINGLRWDDVTEYPELGTTEVWSFINRSGIAHPMHMHLVMFQVLDRQPFEEVGGVVTPTGPRVPSPPEGAGWRDTVHVAPLEILRVIARFEGFTGRYAYHCHILEHEDHEMMRQFQTVSCGNGAVEPGEECDDGGGIAGDGCSAVCETEDFLELAGQAQGGTVEPVIDGILLVVPTSPGQSLADVAAAIAAAIEADPLLTTLGVTAFSSGPTVITTGTIGAVTFTDPGLSRVPMLVPSSQPWALLLLGVLILALLASPRRTPKW